MKAGGRTRWIRGLLVAATVVLGLGIVGSLGLFLAIHRPVPEGTPGPAADAAARALMASVGGREAWEQLEAVRWTFAGRHTHLWDKRRGLHRLEKGDRVVLYDLSTREGVAFDGGTPLGPQATSDAIEAAWSAFCNDSFWLNPVVKVFDPGTMRSLVPLGDGRDGLLVRYTSGGVTPGDAYLWIPGRDGRPEAWRMWVQILPVGGVETSWEGWQTLPGGAQIATRHTVDTIGLTLEITDVSAGDLSQVAPEGDPFAPLVGAPGG